MSGWGKPVHRFLAGIRRELTPVSRKSLFRPITLIYLCFIKHKQQGKMKATNIIIAAVLTLSANVLFAGNDNASTNVANTNTTVSVAALAPEVPAEADFEDAFVFDFISLAPALPAEAQFEDLTTETVSAFNLAPLAPATADFEEAMDLTYLAPAVPAVADFEDAIELSSLAPVVPAVADFE